MRVVAILGGLGSQMFKYAFYLRLRKTDECFIDTIPYKYQEMWNGYELERIFNIQEDDIVHALSEAEIDSLKRNGDNYREAAIKAIVKKEKKKKPIIFLIRGYCYPQNCNKLIILLAVLYNKMKKVLSGDNVEDKYPFFYKTKLFTLYYDEFNHTSDRYLGGGEEKINLRKVFKFPPFLKEKNIRVAESMNKTESVAVHIRRSDHMYDNIQLFENDYFKKAINYIKRYTKNPVFYLFSDEPNWCRNNGRKLGLKKEDLIEIVDWNKEGESFRDMQLMTYCKHNILAISSFGWWGYYLSHHKEKIVCAPKGYWLEVPIHF